MGILEQLGLDPVKLAIQAFNFLLLLYLLNRFAYRPVVGMFDARASRIRTDLESAQAMRDEAEHDRTLRRDQLNKARDEAPRSLRRPTPWLRGCVSRLCSMRRQP